MINSGVATVAAIWYQPILVLIAEKDSALRGLVQNAAKSIPRLSATAFPAENRVSRNLKKQITAIGVVQNACGSIRAM